jgi:soluble lytic murein transglycosylase
VSPQGTSSFSRFLFFFPLFLLTFCGSAQVLDTKRDEAAALLKSGDTSFIRQAELPANFSKAEIRLRQLSLIHPAAPFYSGLLIGENRDSPELELLLLCAALDSPSFPARREAALKLIPIVLKSGNTREARDLLSVLDAGKTKEKTEYLTSLRAACFYSLGRYNDVVKLFSELPPQNQMEYNPGQIWERALALFAVWKSGSGDITLRQEISSFLFEVPTGDVLQWAQGEALSLGGLLTMEELRALSTRFLSGNYGAILNNMRPALADGGILIFRHLSLIADLGRAYQYTPSMREEGAKLFRSWVNMPNNDSSPEITGFFGSLNDEELIARKFMFLFYAGRIERARENYSESSEFFSQAQRIAPDATQSDACIWYMLMNAIARDPSTAGSLVRSTMPQWNDVSYFADILDRMSRSFAGKRQWNNILEIFYSLEGKGASAPLAQYAWILGRASQEGYIRTNRSAESFFRTAFEAGNASFYYRAMAASKLGLSFAPEPEKTADSKTQEDAESKSETDFLLGFFECGAAAFVLSYLEAREAKLSLPELRKIAEAFSASGRWKESLDLVFRYVRRDDYELNVQDLFLSHPRLYLDLIEKYSLETELGAEIVYGLIRTESLFMPEAVSRSGAVGLTQLMPPTALEMAGRIARQGGPDYRGSNGPDLKNPEINIHIGAYYLRYLTGQTGNPMLALLAYNGGIGRMRRWLAADRQQGALPYDLFLETIEYGETREYGRRVLAAAAVYGFLYYGMSMEEVAADIYLEEIYRTTE